MIERRGRVLSSEFRITVDGEGAARALDALAFRAAQEGRATRHRRIDVVREGPGFSIGKDVGPFRLGRYEESARHYARAERLASEEGHGVRGRLAQARANRAATPAPAGCGAFVRA